MSQYDIRPKFECQNRIVTIRYLAPVRMSNRILNVKMQHSAAVSMSKYDFECLNMMLGLSSNVKIGF